MFAYIDSVNISPFGLEFKVSSRPTTNVAVVNINPTKNITGLNSLDGIKCTTNHMDKKKRNQVKREKTAPKINNMIYHPVTPKLAKFV